MDTVIAAGRAGKEPRVRLTALLAAPWYACVPRGRWLMLALFAFFCVGAALLATLTHGAPMRYLAMVSYATGVMVLWASWLSGLLLVARDGHRLRLASVTRNAALSALLYAALLIAAPTLVTAIAGGDVAFTVLAAALAVAVGLGFMLLPRWISVWLSFTPALYTGLHNTLQLPTPLDPRFQHAAWVVLIVLVVAIVQRWRRLSRLDGGDGTGWSGAVIMLARQRAVTGGDWFEQHWAWRRSPAKSIATDLRRSGPDTPAKAFEVALGDWYVPRTWVGWLRGLGRIVLSVALFGAVMMFVTLGKHPSWHKVWTLFGLSAGLWIGLVGGAILGVGTCDVVQRRWSSHAGLALLALLPGFGGAAPARRHLLRAIFTKPAIVLALLLPCMLVPTAWLHLGMWTFVTVVLIEAAIAALATMAVLKVLAGRPLRLAAKIILGVLLIGLCDASITLAFVAPTAQLGSLTQQLEAALALAWLGLAGWAVWRAHAAWCALKRRPHPFLQATSTASLP